MLAVGEKLFLVVAFLVAHSAGSALHGDCLRNEHCGTFDTFCKNGTCVCRENFAVIFDTCVPIATPRVQCARKHECQAALGVRSVCKDARCVCKSFHHMHAGQCVKSRGLDEPCDFDHQCYCGQSCESGIGCADRVCRCKPGFRQHNRRCISISNSVNSASFVTRSAVKLLMVTIFFVIVYV